MAVEGVLPGLRFVEALIRSGHDLLEDVVDGGASAAATSTAASAAAATSSTATADVAVAAAGTSVVYVPIFGGQMSATWDGGNGRSNSKGRRSVGPAVSFFSLHKRATRRVVLIRRSVPVRSSVFIVETKQLPRRAVTQYVVGLSARYQFPFSACEERHVYGLVSFLRSRSL